MAKTSVMVSAEKEDRARMTVKREGDKNSYGEVKFSSENNLYKEGVAQGLKDEDLVLFIYKGLGGLVKEFDTPEEAVKEKERLVKTRKRTSNARL